MPAATHLLYLHGFRPSPQSAKAQYLRRHVLIAAKGDEVLDWRDMVARYPQATVLLQEGGDHGLANFADYVPEIEKFLHWQPRRG